MIPKETKSMAANLLSEDHDDLDLLLSAVFDALDARDAKDVFTRLDLFWARLAIHIRSEHLHLFPAIADAMEQSSESKGSSGDKTDIDAALAQLRTDHDVFMHELASGVNAMRETIGAHPTNADTTMDEITQTLIDLRARLKAHNALEEEIVYRLPARLLDQLKQSALASGVRKELQNLPPRFKSPSDDDAVN